MLESFKRVRKFLKGYTGFQVEQFAHLWDSTVKKADLPVYGWEADPWVWVYTFERCEKPEGFGE